MTTKSILRSVFSPSNIALPQFEDRTHERLIGKDISMGQSVQMSRIPTSSSSTSSRSNRPLRGQPSTIKHGDPLIYIDRTARSLQNHIQRLLDAQSEGLVAGLGSEQHDDAGTSGSLTPTATPTQSVSDSAAHGPSASAWTVSKKQIQPIPVRQPPRKKVTLSGARNGLIRSMHDFAVLKSEESHILSGKLREREEALKRITHYETKETDIHDEISSIESGSVSHSLHSLRTSEHSLVTEIQDLESKLQTLKSRHRVLKAQIRDRESSLQSTLSSFQGSLSLLQTEIQTFLQRPPVTPSSTTDTESSPFYTLNPQRRTLQLARDCWTEENADLSRRKDGVTKDRRALLEGEKLWSETVTEIDEFETEMQRKMQRQSHSALVAENPGGEGELKEFVADMDALIGNLEGKVVRAENSGWNLLVCALGAELEAVREGRAMLGDVLGGDTVDASGDVADRRENGDFAAAQDEETRQSLVRRKDIDADTAAPQQGTAQAASTTAALPAAVTNGTASLSESEDDGPPPELLIDANSNDHGGDGDKDDLGPGPIRAKASARAREVSESEEDEGPGPEFLVSHE